ncbi:MAG: hypothetical protein Q9196_006405 [Gyalolechia fulgens]
MVLFLEHRVNSTIPTWTPEPNGRGTWTVLSSCAITTSLCVWSAVHLNVPQKGKAWAQYVRKFKWLLVGLIAPELVAYVAWQQRYEAKRLLRDIAKSRGQKAEQESQSRIKRKFEQLLSNITRRPEMDPLPTSPAAESLNLGAPWTLVHGFYASMGGFALVADPKRAAFLPSSHTRAALTPEGIIFLLSHEPDALPYLTEAQILDKSKADGLKKTLVCAQATWFCVQCVTRLAQSLPVSLLELNTFAHALCTLVIYILWWKKPLDVEEPTELSDPRLSPIFAYMWMTSKVSADGYVGYDIGGRLRDELDCIWPFENPVLGDLLLQSRTPEARDPTDLPINESPPPPENRVGVHPAGEASAPAPAPGRPEYSFRRYASTGYRLTKTLVSAHLLPSRVLKRPPGLFIRNTAIDHLAPGDVLRWKLAHAAIGRYDLERDLRLRHATPVNGRRLRSRVKPRQWNIVLRVKSAQLALAITISGILYGGLHLAAWSASFPSPVEQLLWRASALFVACNGMLLALYGRLLSSDRAGATGSFLGRTIPGQRRPSPGKGSRKPRLGLRLRRGAATCIWSVVLVVGGVTMPLLWFSYVLARIFLVVESLRTLAYLPPDAFQTPTWPAYFPHIS